MKITRTYRTSPAKTIAASLLLALIAHGQTPPLRDITINFATRTGTTWPLYIAQEGGYFEKYGMKAKLAFAVHPAAVAMIVSGEAQMTNYPLEQAMQAASKDGHVADSRFSLEGSHSFEGVVGFDVQQAVLGEASFQFGRCA